MFWKSKDNEDHLSKYRVTETKNDLQSCIHTVKGWSQWLWTWWWACSVRAHPQEENQCRSVLGLELTIYVYFSKIKSLTHHVYSQVHPGLKCWASVLRGALRSLWSQRRSDCYWHWAASRTAARGAFSLKFCSGCACTQQTAFPLGLGWCSVATWDTVSGLYSKSK